MSGDFDTSLKGNLLMGFATAGYFEGSSVRYELIVDGDDAIIILEESDLEQIADLPNYFLRLGMEIEIENTAREFEDISWCQSHPVLISGEWQFVRDPAKVLSGALVGPKWLQMRSERSKRALANTIGLGESYLNRGVPVLQSFANAVVRNANTNRQVKLGHNESLAYKVRHEIGKSWLKEMPTLETRPVTDEARQSFARAYGMSITDQLSYESYLDQWEFEFSEPQLQECPVDVPRWLWQAYQVEKS